MQPKMGHAGPEVNSRKHSEKVGAGRAAPHLQAEIDSRSRATDVGRELNRDR